jgi:S1-C subfamily serine protease
LRSGYSCNPRDTRLKPGAPKVKAMKHLQWRHLYTRHEKSLLLVAGALIALGITLGHAALTPPPPRITQQDIDAAVGRTLQTKPLPPPSARAYQAVRSAIVRVRTSDSTGTGIVIIDRGVILTSLHVVSGTSRVQVQFADGLESDATIVNTQPENDLAVLAAARVPDDLKPATLRSSKKLVVGEQVTAVGFPYGIGPSVSAGIISGLKREYASPDGKHHLRELIQFDAATNPGSSGGPLVNAAGEVIGIVTAMLSSADKGAVAGIAFAVPIERAAGAAGLPPF